MMNCDYHTLYNESSSQEFRCHNMYAPCMQMQDKFNFFELFYCTLNENIYIFSTLCLFIIYTVLMIMSKTIDNYIAPNITYLR